MFRYRAPAAAPLAGSLLLLVTSLSLSLDLCDERDCANNTDLKICRPFGSSNKTPLYLMGFFPCNTRVRARGLTVAAQMAIRAVERNTSILPNYSMRLSFNNTKVSRFNLNIQCGLLCKLRQVALCPDLSKFTEQFPLYMKVAQTPYTSPATAAICSCCRGSVRRLEIARSKIRFRPQGLNY